MRIEDVRIGMKVVPHSKSVWSSFDDSHVWKKAKENYQPFLYVTGINRFCCLKPEVMLNYDGEDTGDFFLAEDFEPYVEPLSYIGAVNKLCTLKETWIDVLNSYLFVPEIEQIIFNPPATIVKWADGTKTIVKVSEGQTFDKETGVAACFMKKIFGNHSKFKREIENKTAQSKK